MNKKFLGILLGSALVSGCAFTQIGYHKDYRDGPPTLGGAYSKYAIDGYHGDPLPISEVGIITTGGFVKVSSINGIDITEYRSYADRGVDRMGRYQVHLMPGIHNLSLELNGGGHDFSVRSVENIEKTIEIKKGQIIHLSWINKSKTRWGVRVTDGAPAKELVHEEYASLKRHYSQ